MPLPIHVLLAEDSDLYRTGFKEAIKHFPELHLCGIASNASQLLQMLTEMAPHIVVIDVEVPAMKGIATCKQLKAAHPHIGVIAFGIYSQPYAVEDALRAGADGYISKNTSIEEIRDAVIKVHEGGTYYCKEITPTVQAIFKGQATTMVLTKRKRLY
jgi:DNA-binding NarL/FixJ family response regulator